MVVRLGITTGARGHAAMIYQRFGSWRERFPLFDLPIINFLTLILERVISHLIRAPSVSAERVSFGDRSRNEIDSRSNY